MKIEEWRFAEDIIDDTLIFTYLNYSKNIGLYVSEENIKQVNRSEGNVDHSNLRFKNMDFKYVCISSNYLHA